MNLFPQRHLPVGTKWCIAPSWHRWKRSRGRKDGKEKKTTGRWIKMGDYLFKPCATLSSINQGTSTGRLKWLNSNNRSKKIKNKNVEIKDKKESRESKDEEKEIQTFFFFFAVIDSDSGTNLYKNKHTKYHTNKHNLKSVQGASATRTTNMKKSNH